MVGADFGRNARLRVQLRQADRRINGSSSERLRREHDLLLEEENAHKKRMEAVAGFRKTDIIPIGKLQRAIDESDSESEPASESEGTASAAHGNRNELPNADEDTNQADNSFGWNNGTDMSQQVESLAGEDLDEEVEDLDAGEQDYSGFTEAEGMSEDRPEDSLGSIDGEDDSR